MASPAATANPSALLKLARDCRDRGDTAGQVAALDRLLAADQRNIPALIQRADSSLRPATRARRPPSTSWRSASAPPSGVPREIAEELARAKPGLRPLRARIQGVPAPQPGGEGLRSGAIEPALRASRSTSSSGRKRIFLQQPKYYYFPGLPQIQFYERSLFPWFDDVEAATADIRAELEADPAGAGCLCALRPGPRKPPEEGRDGDAQQSRLECPLPLEERRGRRGKRGALSEDDACAPERAALATCQIGRLPSCFRCSGRARTYRRTMASSTRGSSATCP